MSRNDGIATPYAAAYVIFRKDNKIAFVLRAHTGWMNGHYGLPSGRVEKQESLASCALREAKEEVGVIIQPSDLELILTGHRTHPDSDWIDAVFEAKQWTGELYNAEPQIHDELVWLDPNSLPDNMVPYVRDYISAIEAGHNYIEWGWQAKPSEAQIRV